jgi:hypothetical protein
LAGPKRKVPAVRSRMAPKTLGESGRGRHSHSTEPSGATRQLFSPVRQKAVLSDRRETNRGGIEFGLVFWRAPMVKLKTEIDIAQIG